MKKDAAVKIAETFWDVIVVGGGMVGAAAALGLAKSGLNVLVLERNAPDLNWSDEIPYQTRVSALTRASENLLRNLGAWRGIEARRSHPFKAMHIWEASTDVEIHLDAKEVGAPNLGYVVENSVIQASLWEQCVQHPNVTLHVGDEIQSITLEAKPNFQKNSEKVSKELQNSQSCTQLNLDSAGVVLTRLLIGADGAFSKVRQLTGIGLDTHEYGQCAVVGCVKTEKSHQDTCWQRYTADGPFAFLSMSENVSSIAWYLPLEKQQWALSLSDEAFAQAIGETSDYRLGPVIEVAERAAFPLVRRHAQHYVKPGLALAGDAAHTIHPQAGQGVNLGLLDAAALIDVVADAVEKGYDFASLPVLRRYERWRRGDNAIVQRSMEVFDGLFSQTNPSQAQWRQRLLPLADRIKPVKHWLIEEALYGRAPRPTLTQSF
jgi:2-octaprenylphenol hydroxylase